MPAETKDNEIDILPRLRGILMSSDFSNQFEEFAEDNIEPFVKVLDDGKSPTLEHVEHDHELHDIYRLYLETFEKKIETHIVAAGSTLDQFMRDARRTLESAEEFDSSRFFLEALLATTTYETFLGLMMTEARRVKDKRDAKLDTIDEDEEKSGHK